MICPSCGYETFHPKATACDLCAAALYPEDASAPPATGAGPDSGLGELEAIASAVAADDGSSAAKPAKAKSSRSPAKAPKVPRPARQDGETDPLNALLYALALPATLPVGLWGVLGAGSPRQIPVIAWLGWGVVALIVGVAAAFSGGPTYLPLIMGASALFGGILLARTGRAPAGGAAMLAGLLSCATPLALGGAATGYSLKGHRDLIHVLDVSGELLMSGSEDKRALLWSPSQGEEPVFVLDNHTKGLSGVAILKDRLVTSSWDGSIQLWSRADGKLQRMIKASPRGVTCMKVTPQGDLAVFGEPGGEIKIASLSGDEIVSLGSHETAITALAIDHAGERVASASADGLIKVWDLEAKSELTLLEGHERSVRALAFSGNGDRVVSGGYDRFFRVWSTSGELEHEVKTQSPIRTLGAHGNRVVTVQNNRILVLWDVESGEKLGLFKLRQGKVPPGACEISPDGRSVVVGDDRIARSIELDRFAQ